MAERIQITKGTLEAALSRWSREAKEGNWTDDGRPLRHRDSANYLFDILKSMQA